MGLQRATADTAIRGPIGRADLPGLYSRVCLLLEQHRGGELVIDVAGVACDAVCLEAVAHLELGARRHGCRVRLQGASDELVALVAFAGLAEVVSAA